MPKSFHANELWNAIFGEVFKHLDLDYGVRCLATRDAYNPLDDLLGASQPSRQVRREKEEFPLLTVACEVFDRIPELRRWPCLNQKGIQTVPRKQKDPQAGRTLAVRAEGQTPPPTTAVIIPGSPGPPERPDDGSMEAEERKTNGTFVLRVPGVRLKIDFARFFRRQKATGTGR
jgi:hypothetical protein